MFSTRVLQATLQKTFRSQLFTPKVMGSRQYLSVKPVAKLPITKLPITKTVGLSNFMTKVYGQTYFGVLGSLGTAYAIAPFIADQPLIAIGIGFVGSIASIIGISALKPTYHTKKIGTEVVQYAEDQPLRKLSFAGLSIGMGTMISPLITHVMELDPWILPNSMIISSLIFGGCALMAKRCDPRIMTWQGPLMVGLGSLVGLQLLGLGSILCFGPNSFALMIHNVDVYGGIVLFTGFSIYDSYKARIAYEQGKPDTIGCSTELYLDFMNLLIRILEILAKNKK